MKHTNAAVSKAATGPAAFRRLCVETMLEKDDFGNEIPSRL